MLILGSEDDGVAPKNRVRKRRVEMIAKEVKIESPDKKFLRHPEIEDFASDNVYSESIQPPANWERIMEGIRSMRLSEHAPVDSIDPDEGVTSLQPKKQINGCSKMVCSVLTQWIELMKPP